MPLGDGVENDGKSAGGGSVFDGGMPNEFSLVDGEKLPPGAGGGVPFGSGYDAPPAFKGASKRVFPFVGGGVGKPLFIGRWPPPVAGGASGAG